jgi:hypothetical protein
MLCFYCSKVSRIRGGRQPCVDTNITWRFEYKRRIKIYVKSINVKFRQIYLLGIISRPSNRYKTGEPMHWRQFDSPSCVVILHLRKHSITIVIGAILQYDCFAKYLEIVRALECRLLSHPRK